MATTTNYGYTVPDSTSHARIWEHFLTALQAVDTHIAAAVLQGYSNWTPAWTASGTAPAIGNGVRAGRYVQVGKQVHAQGSIIMGSTTTMGTGVYGFSLPVTAASGAKAVGSAYLRDESAAASGHFNGICVINPALSTTVLNLFNVASQVGATAPFVPVSTDSYAWTITYEAA